MDCKRCGSENTYKNGKEKNGDQKYRCAACGYNFTENTVPREHYAQTVKNEAPAPRKLGMSIEDFRKKHDVDYIVDTALAKLDRKTIYEKSDVIALTGLRAGYPGLSAALENATEYKGRSGGVTYWAHPETVEELKRQAIMT
jgi:DNA-directed RNA polymerase subunit M/transcription elongation factor TFIIS